MRVAFTLDDIPMWPRSYPPEWTSTGQIMEEISVALVRHGIRQVYGFANSWSIVKHPELAEPMDKWVAAGHHVGNHTHNHFVLTEVGCEKYTQDIDSAEMHLAPWLGRAPSRFFRYTLCHWGETEEKRVRVARHLAELGLVPADVTSWWYEWHWNRAWRNARDREDDVAMTRLERNFIAACVAQLHYDHAALQQWFGREVPSISLGHTVPFFAKVADRLFGRLVDDGVEFISLEEAAADPAYAMVGSVVSSKFLVYHQKLADAGGRPIPIVAPDAQAQHDAMLREAAGRLD